MSNRGYPTSSFRTSKRPARIMKMAKVGTKWKYKKTGEIYTIAGTRPSHRYSCYIEFENTSWLLPPRYFWDLFERYEDISGQI